MGLSRLELFARMGKVQVVEPLIVEAHREAEDRIWRGQNIGHGEPWHLSNHVSQMPGDDPRYCPRKAVYGLADFAPAEPASAMLHGTAIVGEAIEEDLVERLGWSGRILSAPATAERQTRFEDADVWLGGSPDIVVLPYRWNRPHVIEVKTKDHEVIIDMKNGLRTWDPGHRLQCHGYINLGHEVSPQLWPEVVVCRDTWKLALAQPNEQGDLDELSYMCRVHGEPLVPGACLRRLELEPITTGSIVYHSRNRPGNVRQEYFFERDPSFMVRSRRLLGQVRAAFEEGKIPDHPFEGKEWSQRPCQWCEFKKHICKPDCAKGIKALNESHGVPFTREVRGSYDLGRSYGAVVSRWRGKSGVYAQEVSDTEEAVAA